jgi:hypothetical protein
LDIERPATSRISKEPEALAPV